METRDLIHGLIRACNPVTLSGIVAELHAQRTGWESMHWIDRDTEISDALNGLIRDGLIVLDVDAKTPEIAFDLPDDEPADVCEECARSYGPHYRGPCNH